jgi:Cof subfamily protein (haloacid dehalogenase superfamily)
MTHPIRFLVSDVDGTLVTPDKTVTPAARDAVRALRDAGVGFAFVSSRPPGGLRSIADALDLHGDPAGTDRRPAAAAFNGGLLLDERLQPISFEPLPEADARIALDVFAAMGVDAWVFTIDEWLLVDPHGHYVAHERHTVGFDARVVPSFDALGEDVMRGIGKIVGSSPDPDLLQRAADDLAPRLSTDARAALSQTYYLDVTHAKANKGSALRAIAAHAGLTLDDMAAIGDMANDLAMLEIAGFSIAMGNAPDDVKAAADAVTDSNRDDGFAKAVTQLVLPRAARETP